LQNRYTTKLISYVNNVTWMSRKSQIFRDQLIHNELRLI